MSDFNRIIDALLLAQADLVASAISAAIGADSQAEQKRVAYLAGAARALQCVLAVHHPDGEFKGEALWLTLRHELVGARGEALPGLGIAALALNELGAVRPASDARVQFPKDTRAPGRDYS